MALRVLLIDDSCDLAELAAQDLGAFSDLIVLCWISPDALATIQKRHGQLRFHGLLEVVGGLERWERGAIALMEQVCETGPSHGELPWRFLVAEPLFREALVVRAALDAHALCRRLSDDCLPDLRLKGDLDSLLRGLFDLELVTGSQGSPGLARRLARRGRRVLLTGDLRGQLQILFDQLDPTYRWRCGFHGRRPSPQPETGGVTFFSSYLNNSRILRKVEPYVSGSVHWLVSNHPARQGAAGHRGELHELWRFADREELSTGEDGSQTDFASGDDPQSRASRAWLASSPTWSYWTGAGNLALARLTRCWESYLERVCPRLVVVASQWGIEGWFLMLARRRGIPVLQMLHGILSGEFYTRRPVLSDALVVSGEFWRDLWPEKERARIHICSPPAAHGSDLAARSRQVSRRVLPEKPRALTYFSWPFDRLPFYSESDLMAGFVDLFHELLEEGCCTLILRAHPLENLSDLTRFWQRRHGRLPLGLRLSQAESLGEVVAATEIALMFRSTVMLDCMARSLPILVPGWIDFSWRTELQGIPGLHLAADFRDLRETLLRWIEDPPILDRQKTLEFLRPSSEDQAREKELERLIRDLQADC